jgi:type IV pilus assembly protein PilW
MKIADTGHTLLELLIALSLGIFILMSSFSFYQSVKIKQQRQAAFGIARENAKFAFDLIKADIQLAGFYGCISPMAKQSIVNSLNPPHDHFKWNFLSPIATNQYSGNSWTPALDSSLANSDVYQADILTLRYADRREFSLDSHSSSQSALKTRQKNNLRQYDYVLVSDCVKGSIFQKTNSSNSKTIQHTTEPIPAKYAGNASDDLVYQYSILAKVRRLYSISYFLAKKTGRIPALYRKDGARRAEEVISGISDMQLSFALDRNADGKVDAYSEQINSASDAQAVVLVNFSITAKAFKNTIKTGKEVLLYQDGSEMSYQLNASIALRNHLP